MKFADLATIRVAPNTYVPVTQAVFGKCGCGTVTVWQDGEKPRYTCLNCARKAELAPVLTRQVAKQERKATTRVEHARPTVASLLAEAQTFLKPHETNTTGDTALHQAEHLLGWATANDLVRHIKTFHMGANA